MLTHSFTHALSECLHLFPFLLISYLLIEFVAHKMDARHLELLRRGGRFGPLVSALLGLFPQCGFSAAAASLYSSGFITRGTLIAAFLATSDEMLPILIANRAPNSLILKILAAKVLAGILTGYLIDAIELRRKRIYPSKEVQTTCQHGCSGGVYKTAFCQALKVTGFLLVIIFAVDLSVEYLGVDNLNQFILNQPIFGQFLAGLLGFIPNCAISVVFTTLYLEGGMTFGALLSGLLVGSGIGILVLIRAKKDFKDNLLTIGILYASGVLFGLLSELLSLA